MKDCTLSYDSKVVSEQLRQLRNWAGHELFAYHMQLGPNSFEFAKGKYLAYSKI